MRTKRAVTYFRVSSQEQQQNQTIEGQKPDVARLVASQGIEVLGAVEDDGLTGTKLKGRKLAKVIEDIDTGKLRVDFIVAKALDRVFRVDPDVEQSGIDANHVKHVLKRRKVKILTPGGEYSPEQILMWSIQSGLTEEELSKMRDRMTGGRKRRLKEGFFVFSRAPWGYARQYADKDNPSRGVKLVIDKKAAVFVRSLFRWFAAGGYAHAARKAQEAGIEMPMGGLTKKGETRKGRRADYSPTAWTAGHVLDFIARADQYRGEIRYRYDGTEGTLKVPPILDDKLYLRVKAQMKTRALKSKVRVFLTTGFMRCQCGSLVWTSAPKPERCYLRCNACRKEVRSEGAEDLIWISAIIRLAEILTLQEVKGPDLESRIKAKRAELEGNKAEIARLAMGLARGMQIETWEGANDSLLSAKMLLEAELGELEQGRSEQLEGQGRLVTLRERISVLTGSEPTLERKRDVLRDILGGKRIEVGWAPTMSVTFPEVYGLPARRFVMGDPDLDKIKTVALMGHGFRFSRPV